MSASSSEVIFPSVNGQPMYVYTYVYYTMSDQSEGDLFIWEKFV